MKRNLLVGSMALLAMASSVCADGVAEVRVERAPAAPVMPVMPVEVSIDVDMETEKAAFLGVSVAEAPQALTEQLNLPRNTGLVVEFAEKDSPAEQAGLKPHDLVQKVNDQLLINVDQFRVLIRTFKPGDEVSLAVLRKGETLTLKARLAERDMPVISSRAGQGFSWIQSAGGDGNALVELRGRLNELRELPAPRIVHLNHRGTSSVSMSDENYKIHLKTEDGKSTISVKKADGTKVYEGPFNTDEEKANVPAEVHEMLKNNTPPALPEFPETPAPTRSSNRSTGSST
jgi:serine protease Do